MKSWVKPEINCLGLNETAEGFLGNQLDGVVYEINIHTFFCNATIEIPGVEFGRGGKGGKGGKGGHCRPEEQNS